VGLEISVLKHLFSLAIDNGYISTNPAQILKGPRRHNQRVKTLSKTEFTRLWKESPDWIRPILALGVSGLRRGEILALRSSDINVAERFLIIRHHNTRERKVQLSDFALDMLEQLTTVDPRSKGLLFSEKQMTSGNVSQSFLRAVRSSGIEDGISFDDLRYTGANWLLSKGASLKAAADFLGHEGLRMVEKLTSEDTSSLNLLVNAIDECVPAAVKKLK
jgi:integrase